MTLSDRPSALAPVPWPEVFADLSPSTASALVHGITGDSRAVRPGDLYCAVPGANVHGAKFAAAAVAAGAVGVLTDQAGADQLSDLSIPVAVVQDPRRDMALAAARVYHQPATQLNMFGITGTNGKTTTTYLMDAALRHLGLRTGLVGTVQTRIGEHAAPSIRTTPESYDLQALFAVMVEQGVTHCGIEVSSHAVALHRVGGIRFDLMGFTNLSQDHLDFHGTMAEYFAAKARMFTPDRADHGVIWAGDDWARQLCTQSTIAATIVGFAGTAGADWLVDQVTLGALGSDFVLTEAATGRDFAVHCPLPGDFNIANAAIAVLSLHHGGVALPDAIAGVGACLGVPGRMERVSAATAGPLALVDFAHSPEAVLAACSTVRPVTSGSLVVVVGAGGDRDAGKRPGMGAAAAQLADVVVVTDDNPRSEDPAAIRAEVFAGAQAAAGPKTQVVDLGGRDAAIEYAISHLKGQGDTVLVVGKGHEQGQEIAGVNTPFDDRIHTARALTAAGFEAVADYR